MGFFLKLISWGVFFTIGFIVGGYYTGEKIIYETQTKYITDPSSVTKATMNSEIAKTKEISYNAGYSEGLKTGIDEGYESGYSQGKEHGKTLILDQIDLRVKEAELTDKNVPLFKVRR